MLRTLDSHNELTFKEVVFHKHPYSSNAILTVINIHCKLRIAFCSGKNCHFKMAGHGQISSLVFSVLHCTHYEHFCASSPRYLFKDCLSKYLNLNTKYLSVHIFLFVGLLKSFPVYILKD